MHQVHNWVLQAKLGLSWGLLGAPGMLACASTGRILVMVHEVRAQGQVGGSGSAWLRAPAVVRDDAQAAPRLQFLGLGEAHVRSFTCRAPMRWCSDV